MFLHLCIILFTGVGGFPACITGHMTRGICLQGNLPLKESKSGGRGVCLQWGLHRRGGGCIQAVCIQVGRIQTYLDLDADPPARDTNIHIFYLV